jgi:hypothetical protein
MESIKFSIALLKMNRKTHIAGVKRYTVDKRRKVFEHFHDAFLEDMNKRRLAHQAYLDDLNLAIDILSKSVTVSVQCFRLKCRNLQTNKVINQCDYIGLDNFQKFGTATYHRYNRPNAVPELYEKIDEKWVLIDKDVVSKKYLLHG